MHFLRSLSVWLHAVHSEPPDPEPTVSGCEWDCVCWPCERMPVSLADSYLFLADRIPADFHSRCDVGSFFGVWCSGLGRLVWGWDPSPHKEDLCGGDISLDSQLLNCHFCKSLVMRLLFSSSSVGYSGWLFSNSVVFPVWFWKEVTITSTYLAAISRHLKIFCQVKIFSRKVQNKWMPL